jgi:hypothetical protein
MMTDEVIQLKYGAMKNMSSSDITIYSVMDEGELEQIPLTGPIKDLLSSEMVILMVIDSEHLIYLWKGSNAKVRRKFIAARVSQDLRGQKGLNYRVESIDHGDEPQGFINICGGPIPKEGGSETAPAAGQASAPEVAAALRGGVAPKAAAAPKATPQISPPPSAPTISSAPSISGPAVAQSVGGVQIQVPGNVEAGVKAIISEIEKHPPPAPYQRELVIIGPYAFSVAETRRAAFGQEQIEHRWELAAPPEGQFLAQGYTPRTIIQSGKVLAVELLKGGSEGGAAAPDTPIQIFKIK